MWKLKCILANDKHAQVLTISKCYEKYKGNCRDFAEMWN